MALGSCQHSNPAQLAALALIARLVQRRWITNLKLGSLLQHRLLLASFLRMYSQSLVRRRCMVLLSDCPALLGEGKYPAVSKAKVSSPLPPTPNASPPFPAAYCAYTYVMICVLGANSMRCWGRIRKEVICSTKFRSSAFMIKSPTTERKLGNCQGLLNCCMPSYFSLDFIVLRKI